ncbi:MAG: tetratricopeptide repeat protein [Armatimonadota bacterium]|nr:tetratricopeptide repeat protein [Armatimonadota bacterium]
MEIIVRFKGFFKRNELSILGAVAIVLMVVVAYIPSLDGAFIWDDDANVTQNMTLRSWKGLVEIWTNLRANQQYYPLTHTSFWIQYHLWNLNPFAYHLANILLHALNAILLWFILRRLLIPGAWLAAAVFAIHPVHVESVAWITERKNVLSGAFYFASMLAYIRFAGLDGTSGSPRRYWMAFVLFICAVLSKTVVSTLPAALLILIWWKKGRLKWSDVLPLVPFFLLGAGMGQLTAYLEKHHVGAVGEEWNMPLINKILVAGRIPWFYAWKLVWPINLTFNYPKWHINPTEPLQYIYPIGVVILIVSLFMLRRVIGNSPLAAVLYFGVTLVPALGIFNVYFMRYSYVQDHFQYLASVGIIVLISGMLATVAKKFESLSFIGAAPILLILGVLTYRQCFIYKDCQTLWLDTIAKNPDSWMAHNNLGNEYTHQGRLDLAVKEYKEALKSNPKEPEIYYNLGTALVRLGRIDDGIKQYKTALRLDPNYADAHSNLAVSLAAKGQTEEARKHYVIALKLNPRNANAHYNFGTLLAMEGKVDEAISHYKRALELNPDFVEGHINLGDILSRKGNYEEAIQHYSKAVQLRPNFAQAHLSLGALYALMQNYDEAIEHLKYGLELSPKNAEGHYNLAVAFYSKGDYAAAWEEIRLAEQYGMKPNPAFIQALSKQMPKPQLSK